MNTILSVDIRSLHKLIWQLLTIVVIVKVISWPNATVYSQLAYIYFLLISHFEKKLYIKKTFCMHLINKIERIYLDKR